MKEMTRTECKEEMIKILKYIDDVCIKNNINYTLIGGSLIGAIRHKGIIPWDDDIDIGLMYADYLKLIDILKNEKSNDFILVDCETNNKYTNPHAKLISERTYLKERNFESIPEMGIFVDIFLYMYTPENEKDKDKFYKKLMFYIKMIMGTRKPSKKENKYLLRYIRYIISKVIGREKLYKKINELYGKYKNGNSIVSNFPIYGKNNEIQDADIFNSFIRTKFENIDVNITSEYDKKKKNTFGDYMQLPPEDKRVNHQLKAYYR